ncbi:hypothetical protein A2U01_0115258, partial [Trifolium medium]|nr:hypothetical protein [Trifolium medium]
VALLILEEMSGMLSPLATQMLVKRNKMVSLW